jgi:hypothetical protein
MEATGVNAASNRRSPKKVLYNRNKNEWNGESGDTRGRKDSKPRVNVEAARNINEY